jgi:hypothetical protein
MTPRPQIGEVVAKRSLLRVGEVSGLGVCRKGLAKQPDRTWSSSRSRWQLLWPHLRQDNKRVTWFAPMKKLPKNLSPELEELRSGLIGALPLLGNELASMFGRPLPRLSARDKAGLEKKIDRLLRSTSPFKSWENSKAIPPQTSSVAPPSRSLWHPCSAPADGGCV